MAIIPFHLLVLGLILLAQSARAEIPKPTDAPKPLAPAEELKSFQVPAGFRMELVASEPLITEPTGVCWDERGRLHVCELHGYNLEGELEIREMNKTGVLDTKVQRVQAAEKFKRAAEAGTYGVVKRLTDSNGDGTMDRVQVLATNLPPAFGICPARGGIIVAGQAEIVFIADRDDDGAAEVRETLVTGFKSGMLERGVNAPQWGPDGWVYFGRGWAGGTVTGPRLAGPVHLPGSDFRIRPDGSAIEPVSGGTHTIGLAFTPEGDRFFTATWKHALYAVPIEWRYLERNPDAAAPPLEADASDSTTVYPLAPVHPWKKRRSNDPGWKELYGKYGIAEGVESGYFTSCCSPLVYQDTAFPAEFYGNLFVCEPAQNLVHRSVVRREGPELRVHRAAGEETNEFLASTDPWFRPVQLAHGPDGSVFIVDMYREIIEDYSAVPRFMQQQYGLAGGVNHGRIWRLVATHGSPSVRSAADLSRLNDIQLAQELDSLHFWRRQTAERLLRERTSDNHPELARRRGSLEEVATRLRNAGRESPGTAADSRESAAASPLRPRNQINRAIEILRAHDRSLVTDAAAARQLSALSRQVTDSRLLLQLALSLGYSGEREAFEAIARLARDHGDVRWMPAAILTGMHRRAGQMLTTLLSDPGLHGGALFEPLAASLAARRDPAELADALVAIAAAMSPAHQAACLKGLKSLKPGPLAQHGQDALSRLLEHQDLAVRGLAASLAGVLKLGDPAALKSAMNQAASDASNLQLSGGKRLAAVALLAGSDDSEAARLLLAAWSSGSPAVRAAIIDALLGDADRLPGLVDALEQTILTASALNASQRTRLLERADPHLRPRVEAVFLRATNPDVAATVQRYLAALNGPRDLKRGGELFQQNCAPCHRVKNEGAAVGPDLSLAFQRSEETVIRDILAPSDAISSGYETYHVTTRDGDQHSGVLVSDSATSVTLRLGGAVEHTLLRKDIADIESSSVSMMPEGFVDALSPQDCADLLGWLRARLANN